MDELAERRRERRLFELIEASDAMNNARVELEDAAAADTGSEERWEEISRHVLPLLERERVRLEEEISRLRG